MAARCAREGGAPVPAESRRILLRPQALAFASDEPTDGLGASVTLGSDSGSHRAIYVRFDPRWKNGKVISAFLLLEPSAGAPRGGDVGLEVWRAEKTWQGPNLPCSRQPGLAPPFARGIGRAAPALPVRIDVTELVRFFADHPERDHGFVVRASDAHDPGITLATGLDGGEPPRLDVYLSN